MSARVPLTFRIYKGEQLLREETLALGVIKIGKVASAHLRIDDESVSRMHAILEIDHAGAVHVIDLGSTRGTFVNGQRINKAKLESGDSMKVGEITVYLTIGAAATAATDLQPSAVRPVAISDVHSSALRPAATPAVHNSALRPAATPAVQTPDVRPAPPAVAMSAASLPLPAAAPSPMAPALPVRAPAMQRSGDPVPAVQAVLFDTAPLSGAALYNAESIDDGSGAKAIEIAAMLGDSVIGVKHCMNPNSGKVSPRTWGMLAAGAGCLLMSGIAFALSVRTAAFNKGALDAWVRIAHKPAYSYRPHELSAGYDFLAFGGFLVGLVMLATFLLRIRNEKRSPYYRIGTAPGVELPLEHAPTADFPLVAPSGDDFVFNYGAGMDGEMILDGRSTALSELLATGRARHSPSTIGAIEVPIPARARIRARAGQTTFLVSSVAQPHRQVTPLFSGLQSRTMSYFAGSLAVHLGIWALLQQIPVESGSADIDLAILEAPTTRTTGTENDDVPPENQPDDGQSGGTEGAATAMNLPEGAAGTTKSSVLDSHMRMKDNQVPPQVARAQAIEDARKAGFLGEASSLSGAAFAALTAQGDLSSGIDADNVYGALEGRDGEGNGNFGYGRSQFGAGGGCTIEPCGMIGTSRGYNTIGTGAKAGDGWGGPGRGHNLRPHHGETPQPVLGQATGPGDLDGPTIRRYIKRNIEKFSYCYSKELLAHPTIEGTVSASFFISPSGSVQASKASGFDANVASCVADVVSGIEFPKPRGGGGVQVNYPFTFHTPHGA